jgi:phosphohistidine phosphatase
MGERLARRECDADLVISSPAIRALATAEAIAEEIGYPPFDIAVDEGLYEADAFELLEVIQGLDDALDHVMCVSHNPGLTELANYLAPHHYIDNIPTCGIVELTFDTDTWARVGHVIPTQMHFDYPKKTHP